MLRRIILGSWLFGAAGAALAQIDAPQLGWVPDGTRIRPVYGIPASAAVGAAAGTQDLLRVAASASRNYVLVCATDTGVVAVYQPGTGLTPLDGAGIAPDSIVLSPGGSAAALWFNSIHQVQIVTGLPEAPSIRQLDASFLGSSPVALALSDDGAWLAGAWLGETSRGVYAFGPNGEVNRLPIEDRVLALAFFALTHDIAAASTGGLLRVAGIGSFVQVSTLAAFADSSPPAVAVAVTQDNKVVLAVDRSGLITAAQTESGAATTLATTIDCGCSPEGLFAMGPSAFRLTGLQGGAFKLFDAAVGEVLFAPLALSESAEGAAQ